ncbi:Protein of unknown function [Bacillus mycoides]|jgi:hypothetical protein
MENE